MDCRSSNGATCAIPLRREVRSCPSCGRRGKAVRIRTVKNLVRDHTRVLPQDRYWFCRTPQCEVVYFGEDLVFHKSDIKVRVGLKETEDPVPLCYCFNYTRADIQRDIEQHGRSEILERVKAEVQGGFCACEVKNPSGNCCLGEIHRTLELRQAMDKAVFKGGRAAA